MQIAKRHRKVLLNIYRHPTAANITWTSVIALLTALGAEISEGAGSRTRVALNGVRAVFHRPHPSNEINKATVNSLRKFLQRAGVE